MEENINNHLTNFHLVKKKFWTGFFLLNNKIFLLTQGTINIAYNSSF